MSQPGFFDMDRLLEALTAAGDPLVILAERIPWERFRPLLERAVEAGRRKHPRKSNAGRKPYDAVMMFKVLILQSLNALSDAQAEYQIRDRLSFRRFLGLEPRELGPDENTVWLFREHLTLAGAVETLFEEFNRHLEEQGLAAEGGQIVDARIVEVPRQRNTPGENVAIKRGETPEGWGERAAKDRQKDTDAAWTKKRGHQHYGYKNHVDVDVKHKLIRKYAVTPANVHDSQALGALLDGDNQGAGVWGDSAYRSAEIEETLAARGFWSWIHFKGYRGHPLSEWQKRLNRSRSKVRARVEHAFGLQENTMRARMLRCIGLARAAPRIGLWNLTHNMIRYTQLRRGPA